MSTAESTETSSPTRDAPGLKLPHGYERFALALLISTRSELNRAWRDKDNEKIDRVLQDLQLSKPVETSARIFLKMNESSKDPFLETAERFGSMVYSGDPCPPAPIAKVIVEALQNLDRASRADSADRLSK